MSLARFSGALSYLSVNQGQGHVHHAVLSIYAATENVTPRRGLSSSVFISAQSYGAILLLLGIISGWSSASCCKAPVTPALCLAMQIKLFPNATCVQELRDLIVAESSPEEAPEEEKYDDRRNACDRTVLFQ
jgi:hypothetical protein